MESCRNARTGHDSIAFFPLPLIPCLLATLLVVAFLGCKERQPVTNEGASPARNSSMAAGKPNLKNEPGMSGSGSLESVLFDEVVDPALASIQYRNGEEGGVSSIVESLGGGVAIADFDRDGWPDIVAPGGGEIALPKHMVGLPTQLLRGLGELKFVAVSVPSRIAASAHYTHGVAVADYDNDGFPDCLITGYGGLQLWKNMGDGTFVTMAHAAQLVDTSWSSSAAWADVNADGNLDLYVCHYADWSFENNPPCPSEDPKLPEVCSPREFTGLDDVLYISDGAGGFADGTKAWGLAKEGKGLGVVAADLNDDGRIDIYVANDTVDNFLYNNLGNSFEENATVAGVAVDDQGIPNGSMGTDVADYNGDLRPDLWAANYERESFALYRNEGAGLFLHVSRPTGITALGGLFVGFGSAFLDADGDADLDIVVVNGHVMKYPQFSRRAQRPLLLMNDKPRFLRRIFPDDHYFQMAHEGRGLATGDVDRDGHLDILVSQLNAPPTLLRSTLGSEQRSLSVHLIGRNSNRSAIGSQLVLECEQGLRLLRTINGGGSYLSTHQPIIIFELPSGNTPKQLTIRWPNGQVQVLEAPQLVDRQLVILEL